jgi:hypothetical protein
MGGAASQQAAEYNADVAENNKIIAESLAKDAKERGRIAEKKQRVGIEGFKGTQRTALAKSGVVVDQDTALSLLLDTAEFGEESALNVRANAEREAFGFRAQGAGFAADAAIAGAQGRTAGTAGALQAAGHILSA